MTLILYSFPSYGLLRLLIGAIVYTDLIRLHAASVKVYSGSTLGQMAPLRRDNSLCIEYCHQPCEKYRSDLIPGNQPSLTEIWSRVESCKDANKRCDCGPVPSPYNEYNEDREPTKAECRKICHKTCKWGDGSEEYKFCKAAKPKCACGVNPALLWPLGIFGLICLGVLSCYCCRRARLRRAAATTARTLDRGGFAGFAPVIPPAPVWQQPQQPYYNSYNQYAAPAPAPLTPVVTPGPSAPPLGWPVSKEDDLPPPYSEVIRNY